jgi:hypothetical protein
MNSIHGCMLIICIVLSLIIIKHLLRKLAKKEFVQRGYILESSGIVLFEVIGDVTNKIHHYPMTNDIACLEHLISYTPPKMREYFNPSDLLPEQQIETLDFSDIKANIFGRLPGVEGKGIKKIKIRAKYDNRVYTVRDFGDYQEAAEILAKLNADANKLIDYLKESFPNSPYTHALIKNYNGDLEEETPKNLENLTSYTVDKEKIISCLRTKNGNHELHDYNLLLYVFIHEMSHMANDRSYGHDVLFDNSFEFLLKRADEIRILKRINFEENPQNFCGLPITSNVAY